MMLSAANIYAQTDQDEATICCTNGIQLIQDGNYPEARNVLDKGYSLASGQLKTKCAYYKGISYYFEAANQYATAEYKSAYANFGEALKYFIRTTAYKDICSTSQVMGDINNRVYGFYDLAAEQYRYAFDVAHKYNLVKAQFSALSSLVDAYDNQKLWLKKIEYSLRLDSLANSTNDVDLRHEMLLYLGEQARMSKDYKLANSYFQQVLNEGYAGNEYLLYNKLRGLAIDEEMYDDAIKYGERCIASFAKEFRDDPTQKYQAYAIQADIYRMLGDKNNSTRCLDSLFVSQRYGVNNIAKARQYCQRGRIKAAFQDYDAAISDYNIAESLLTDTVRSAAMDLFLSNIALRAGAYYKNKQYEQSKHEYRQYAQYMSSLYGQRSSNYAISLGYLANIEGYNAEYDSGSQHYQEAASLMLDIANADLRYLPSSSRKQYWDNVSSLLWSMSAYGLACGLEQNEFTETAYNTLLFSKGLMLASERTMDQLVKSSNDTELIRDYNRWIILKQQKTDAEAKNDVATATNVSTELHTLDNQLSQQLNALGGLNLQDDITYQKLRSSIATEETVVDFTDFIDKDSIHQYVAYITKANWQHPKLVPVCSAEQIDSLLATVGGNADKLYKGNTALMLSQIILSPLRQYIGAGTTYFIPSGMLHTMALEAIPDAEHCHLMRLSSAKEIVTHNLAPKMQNVTTAVLYGDLDYDMSSTDMEQMHTRYELPSLNAMRSADVVRGDTIFTKLASTLKEVSEINRILSAEGLSVIPYTEQNGTEESFISMSGNSPDILHLATHGFYYTPTDAHKARALSGYDDIMYLTGVVMSGGNAEWQGQKLPDGVLGGLLTSEDISHTDLSKTKLVVLSACDTGRGEATNEGLFGLQRAFKKAGAQTIVMSLWQVSDMVTQEFMVEFYKHLTSSHWDKRKAFDQAKAEIKQRYPEPFYWAGFIMID
jgi:CHAT domain-containing protein